MQRVYITSNVYSYIVLFHQIGKVLALGRFAGHSVNTYRLRIKFFFRCSVLVSGHEQKLL
jgi:hypothetical protein